jgi:hypothetical protein
MEETQSVLRRAVLSEQTWAEVLDRFDRAGLTIDEFCSREGISRSSLTRRRTLRNKQRGIASPLRTNKVAPTTVPKAAFVDLGDLAGVHGSGNGAMELRIELGSGMSLHLVRR